LGTHSIGENNYNKKMATKTFKDLTDNEKLFFDYIESFFLKHKTLSKVNFVRVLGVLINKHKCKGGKK